MGRSTTFAVMVLVLLGAPSARADSLFGLSFFGEPTRTTDARIEGRGGAGLAVRDSVNAAVQQATQLADLKRVAIGVSNVFTRRGSEDTGGSITRNGLNTPSIRMGFPLFGRGGFGLGFSAWRSTQWTLVRPSTIDPTAIETIERSGTLFEVPLLLAWRFGDHLTLGTGLYLLRGNVRAAFDIDLADPDDVDPQTVREDIYTGTATEFSFAVHDVGPVSFAGHFIPEYDADVEVRQRGLALEDREASERTDTMPARWGVGARAALGGDWAVVADYAVEAWSGYEGRAFTFDEGVFDADGDSVELVDETEWRFGLEREARRRGFGATTPVRLGGYLRRWHYPLNGNEVTEWGVSLGTGVVLRAGTARADISIGYGRIGNLDDNEATEDVLRFVLSLSGSERWY